MKMNIYDVIIKPIFTEKGTEIHNPLNKYVFEVAPEANKIQVKEAVEKCFDVKVAKVNVIVRKGKKKRVRRKEGYTKMRKIAIVTLKEGTIELI